MSRSKLQEIKPSFEGYIATSKDALIIIQNALEGKLSLISRRPKEKERSNLIKSGKIFVFIEESSGIKRWTDGVSWSPSRILGRFLIYRELAKDIENAKKFDKFTSNYPVTAFEMAGGEGIIPNSSANAKRKRSRDEMNEQNSNSTDNNKNSSSNDDAEDDDINANSDQLNIYKNNGLVKKSLSITLDENSPNKQTIHLLSYYDSEDVLNKNLITPSECEQFKDTKLKFNILEALRSTSLGQTVATGRKFSDSNLIEGQGFLEMDGIEDTVIRDFVKDYEIRQNDYLPNKRRELSSQQRQFIQQPQSQPQQLQQNQYMQQQQQQQQSQKQQPQQQLQYRIQQQPPPLQSRMSYNSNGYYDVNQLPQQYCQLQYALPPPYPYRRPQSQSFIYPNDNVTPNSSISSIPSISSASSGYSKAGSFGSATTARSYSTNSIDQYPCQPQTQCQPQGQPTQLQLPQQQQSQPSSHQQLPLKNQNIPLSLFKNNNQSPAPASTSPSRSNTPSFIPFSYKQLPIQQPQSQFQPQSQSINNYYFNNGQNRLLLLSNTSSLNNLVTSANAPNTEPNSMLPPLLNKIREESPSPTSTLGYNPLSGSTSNTSATMTANTTATPRYYNILPQ